MPIAVAAGSSRCSARRSASRTSEITSDVSEAATIRVAPGHSSHSTSGPNQTAVALSGPGAAQPFCKAKGASHTQLIRPPRPTEIPIRSPEMAPKPTISTDGSSASPRFIAVTVAGVLLASGIASTALSGGASGPSANPVVTNFSTALNTALSDRSFRRAAASGPPPWISCMVSAVTTPEGNGSRSRISN